MPAFPLDLATLPPTSATTAALETEAQLRREITSLRTASTPDPRLHLARLLSLVTASHSTSPLLRAMRESIQARLAAHSAADDLELYDVALAALDAFIAVRVRGASAKASAFFDQLCRERSWTSLALFGASTVAEAAFLAVNAPRKKLTVIDSAPAYEGRHIAKRLAADSGAPVKYGMLASCHRLLEGADAVVIGAEEVAMNGTVLATPGTSVVVQVARELGVSVVVTTQAAKFSENMVVDWIYAAYDVIRPNEVLAIVTEMDTGTWTAASAPNVLRRLAGI